MSFLGGVSFYSTRIYAASEESGFLLPVNLEPGWVIKVYDVQDALLDVYDTTIQFSDILKVDFDETERGPSEATISIPQHLADRWDDFYRVDIHPYRDRHPWWSGFVTRTPYSYSKRWPAPVKAWGWARFLDFVTITGTWSGVSVAEAVDDIARDIENRTRIVYNGDLIEGGSYVIGAAQPFSPVRQRASDVLDNLATMAGGHVWGVDARRRLYFRPFDEEERYWKWLEPHIQEFEIYSDSSDLCNRLHVKSGKVQGAGQDTFVVTQNEFGSQAQYGTREDVETAPSVLDDDDAFVWGDERVLRRRDPKDICSIDDITLAVGERIQAKGLIRVHLRSGESVLLPIKRVAYNMTSRETRATLDLGEIRRSPYDSSREFWEDIERQQLLHDQTLRQVS